jgi:hypothetical protein
VNLEFQIAVWQENLPVESLPVDGWVHVAAHPAPTL